jgi:methionyl-tRNA synthetase
MDNYQLRDAFQHSLALAAAGNRYFQTKKPWETLKRDPEDCGNTMYVASNLVRSLTVLFSPFIPFACDELWKQLKLEGIAGKQRFEDVDKLLLPAGHRIGEIEPLFKKIEI